MPAPAVYVLAIIGTVGAALAFKEFVYEPHIAPAIDRWKLEYQAARRRRQAQAAAMHRSETDLLMSQRGGPSSREDGDEDISDNDRPLRGPGARFMSDGLLLRRQEQGSSYLDSVELDDLVAREVSEWRNQTAGQVLRQRRNVSEHSVMDEANHSISFVPLSPSKTHVVVDSSTSTSASGSRVSSPPIQPKSHLPNIFFPPAVEASASQGPVCDVRGLPSPPESPQAPPLSATPPMSQALWSPPPQTSPFQHTITQSTLTGNVNSSASISLPSPNLNSSNVSSTFNTDNDEQLQPPPFHRTPTFAASPIRSPELQAEPSTSSTVHGLVSVPSLSQSYPQDLDYEHGLELLSPPSSRSISPFSMSGMSPHPFSANDQSLRALSPFDNIPSRSVSSMSNFSSVMSSPAVIPTNVRSPLMMELGNGSYDTLSPVALQARQIDQPQRAPSAAVSPFLDPSPAQRHTETLSATNSARSTTYLSFDEDDAQRSPMGSPQPYANLAASIGAEGTFGPASVYRSMHQSMYQSQSQSSSSIRASPSTVLDPLMPIQRNTSSSSSSSLSYNESSPEGQSLGLSFFPVAPPLPSESQVIARPQVPTYGDGDLSDLDLMSDYTQSEVSGSDIGDISDFGEEQPSSRGPGAHGPRVSGHNSGASRANRSDGNESDSSWSLAGSPVMTAPASVRDGERGGTIRARGAGGGAARTGYGFGGPGR